MKTNSFMKNAGVIISSGAIMGVLVLGGTAFADSTTSQTGMQGGMGHGFGGRGGMNMGMRMPGVFGTVSAINGTTLTVTSKMGARMGTNTGSGSSNTASATTQTSFTVNADGATVTKDNASSTLSAIAVGDTVMVMGTVSGSSVTATSIHDGVGMGMMGMRGGHMNGTGSNGNNGAASALAGNGLPVVGGNVTAVSGTTLTITNKSNVTYSVDVSSTTVQKAGAKTSASNIVVGDMVVVQGTVNGNSVVASTVIDQGVTPTTSNGTPGSSQPSNGGGPKMGFFGGITSFFKHLFGF